MIHGRQNAVDWLISQKLQQVESQASSSLARVRHAKTIEDIVRAADVHVPAEVRFMRNSIRGLRLLESEAEQCIQVMLEKRLKLISEADSAADAKSKRGRLLQDCSMLRGNFPRQYGHADRESQRLVYLKEREEKPGDDSSDNSPVL